jgi:coenzyme F420-dependent glucose-6-phosphate dehydrogenase
MDTSIQYGLTLSSEEHNPSRLLEIAVLAEHTGFDFVSISDHYHPWVDEQGHSSFVWSMLGAIAARTSTIGIAVGVTCPIMRIHPAILAQATATCADLMGDRFTWGVGTGEALNEHVLGDRWPPADLRLDMLEEAVDVVRKLWTGEQVTHRGPHFTVENARIYDAPATPPPVIVSAFGPAAATLAARIGDGLYVTGPAVDIIQRWRDEGGTGPVYAQLTLCWAEDRDKAVETAHRIWPNTGVPGQLSQDLPTPAHFEQASSTVTADQIAESVSCGPDPEPVIGAVEEMLDAGVDHVYLHQIGPDQEAFCRFWTDRVAPGLSGRGA